MQILNVLLQPDTALNRRMRNIGGLILACLAVQLAYWLVINPILFASPQRPDLIPVGTAAMATVQSPDPAGFDRAAFKPIKLPHSDCCSPGYRLVRIDFALTQVPPDGLALVPSLGSDNYHIRVNGLWTHQDGRLSLPNPTYHGNKKTILYVPPSVLRLGENRLEYAIVRANLPYFDVGQPVLAPYAKASELLAQRNFALGEYKIISYSLGLFAAALAFLLLVRSEQKRFAFWVCALLTAWSLRYHYYTWVDPPFSAGWRSIYYFILTLTIPVAWVNVIDAWTARPMRWLTWLTCLIWAPIALSFSNLLTANGSGPYDQAVELTNGAGMILGAAGVLRFAWHFLTRSEDRNWEASLFILCITLMLVEFHSEYLGGSSAGHLHNSFLFLIIAFPVAFIARNIRLFRSMNDFNEQLTGQLREREAELAESYARQEELARRETLVAERQRLMRDMHDGVGGQLMNLLFAARQKSLPREELTQSLQAVIDELRLIINSLDTVGKSLSAALASFRSRIEPRLRAAGIAIDWANSLPEGLPELPPRTILQVFRIVQEAITNAIKHSGTKALGVTIGLAKAEAPALQISISDRGEGFDPATATGGRGLENMATRAAAIGGMLALAPGKAGTTVTLTVPLGG